MDAQWDNLIPFTPSVPKSGQFPVAFILMVIGTLTPGTVLLLPIL